MTLVPKQEARKNIAKNELSGISRQVKKIEVFENIEQLEKIQLLQILQQLK